jgi:hypothetical protein
MQSRQCNHCSGISARCTRVAASIKNWRLPSYTAVMTRRHRWHCCHAPHHCQWLCCSSVGPQRLFLQWSGQCSAGIFVGVALASLLASCWCHHQHCAVVFAGTVPAWLPLSHGIITLIALVLVPSLHPRCCQHHKLASAQSGCSCDTLALMVLLPSLPVASLQYPALFPGNLAFGGPANAALEFMPALRWSPCLHCAGVIASIVLLSLLVLHQHCCPCCVGVFALIAPALSPASQTGICPVTTQSQHIGERVVVAVLFVLTRGFVAITGILPWQLGL